MNNKRCLKNRIFSRNPLTDNAGTTLVEMIVTFALLSIFLAAAASIISTITTMYYQTKGETYSKQVGDIIMEKAASEIEGAQFDITQPGNNPVLDGDASNTSGTSMTFYDRTDTNLTLKVENERFVIDYAEITGSPSVNRAATTWKFDENIYRGFDITDFKIIRGDALSSYASEVGGYGITDNLDGYDEDVMLILLTIDNDRYGEYKFFRFVRMYQFEK